MEQKLNEIVFDGGKDTDNILEQLLTSNHFVNGGLDISKFLDQDLTINLEKLELAIILLIEFLEKSVIFENPIYVILENMEEYMRMRRITDIVKITEETNFILKFSQAVAYENKINRDVIVAYRGKDA